jgi:hypothetical protein
MPVSRARQGAVAESTEGKNGVLKIKEHLKKLITSVFKWL